MPACPNCGDVLTAAEWKTGTCPMCGAGTDGVAPAEHIPPVDGVVVEAEDRPGWGTVRAGLALVITGTILIWAFGAAAFTSYASVERARRVLGSGPAGAGAETMFRVSSLTVFIAVFMTLSGMAMCSGVPSSAGIRGWIFASVGCMGLMFVVAVFVGFMGLANRITESRSFTSSDYESRPVGLRRSAHRMPYEKTGIETWDKIGKIFGLASQLLFLVFVWSLARFVRKRGLAMSALMLVVATAVLDAAVVSMLWSKQRVGMIDQMHESVTKFGDFGVLFILLALVMSIFYVYTLIAMRANLTKLLRGEPL